MSGNFLPQEYKSDFLPLMILLHSEAILGDMVCDFIGILTATFHKISHHVCPFGCQ